MALTVKSSGRSFSEGFAPVGEKQPKEIAVETIAQPPSLATDLPSDLGGEFGGEFDGGNEARFAPEYQQEQSYDQYQQQAAPALPPVAESVSIPAAPLAQPKIQMPNQLVDQFSGGTDSILPTGSGSIEKVINEDELKLINALAALQIQYGRPDEAAAWLASVRKQYPADYQSARLFAVSLLKMERFEEAEAAIAQLEQIETEGGWSLLYRSLLDFKSNKLASARSWFQKFIGMRSNTSSRNNTLPGQAQ